MTAPARAPLLGHLPAFLRDPLAFLQRLRSAGEIVPVDLLHLRIYVVSSPELIHRVLVDDAASFGKGRIFDKARDVVGNGLALSDGAFHLRQRRLMQPAFHRARIARYVAIRREECARMIATWAPGDVLRADTALQELALGVAAKCLFCTEVGADVVAELLRSLSIVTGGMAFRTFLPDRVERLPTPGNRRFREAALRLRTVMDAVIASYRQSGVDQGDLMSMLLAARDEETGAAMPPEQVRAEVMTLMLAATETTGATLAWVFHELDEHPEVQDALARELQRVLGDGPVAYHHLSELPYTRAVLWETLRLHAPNWILMRRAERDISLGSERLAAGDELLFSVYALHRDPAFYPEPLRFDPSRWLPGRPPPPRGAYIPFGDGLRKCIGDQFALAEMTVVLATVMARFGLRKVGRRRVGERLLATVRPTALPMIITRRAI